MQGGRGCGQPLVVLSQSAKSCRPSKVPFDDPAAQQKHESSLGLGTLDHLQPDAVFSRGLASVFARVILIDPGQLHLLACDLLYSLGQHANLVTILLVGCGDVQRQQMAQRVDGRVHFGSTPSSLASCLWANPRARRVAMRRSGNVAAGAEGSKPRNWTMAGMYWTGGLDAMPSQLVMVNECTPISSTTRDWRRPRSSRRVRIWSPKVFNFFA